MSAIPSREVTSAQIRAISFGFYSDEEVCIYLEGDTSVFNIDFFLCQIRLKPIAQALIG
jgi:hypothetical protein